MSQYQYNPFTNNLDIVGSGGGGSGVTSVTGTTNRITATPTTGAVVVDIASTYVGQTSLTTLGTITTGTWDSTAIGPTFGGTGQTSYTTGDILYSSASNTLSKLPIGTTGEILTVAAGIPSWAASGPTVTSVSGTAPIVVTPTTGNAVVSLTTPLVGQYGGTGVANTGLTIDQSAGAVGYFMTSDGSGNGTWQAPPGVTLVSYTPQMGDGGNNFITVGSLAGYCEIGPNLVWVFVHINWSSQGAANPSSICQISLPFAIGSDRATFSPGYLHGFPTGPTQFVYLLQYTQQYVTIGGINSGTTVQQDCGSFSSSGECQFSGVYYTM